MEAFDGFKNPSAVASNNPGTASPLDIVENGNAPSVRTTVVHRSSRANSSRISRAETTDTAFIPEIPA